MHRTLKAENLASIGRRRIRHWRWQNQTRKPRKNSRRAGQHDALVLVTQGTELQMKSTRPEPQRRSLGRRPGARRACDRAESPRTTLARRSTAAPWSSRGQGPPASMPIPPGSATAAENEDQGAGEKHHRLHAARNGDGHRAEVLGVAETPKSRGRRKQGVRSRRLATVVDRGDREKGTRQTTAPPGRSPCPFRPSTQGNARGKFQAGSKSVAHPRPPRGRCESTR